MLFSSLQNRCHTDLLSDWRDSYAGINSPAPNTTSGVIDWSKCTFEVFWGFSLIWKFHSNNEETVWKQASMLEGWDKGCHHVTPNLVEGDKNPQYVARVQNILLFISWKQLCHHSIISVLIFYKICDNYLHEYKSLWKCLLVYVTTYTLRPNHVKNYLLSIPSNRFWFSTNYTH